MKCYLPHTNTFIGSFIDVLSDHFESFPTLSLSDRDSVNECRAVIFVKKEFFSDGTVHLGNLSTYHVKLADGTMMKAQIANTRRLSRRSLTWEDNVWLSWTDTAPVLLES